ncbi:MAG: hypothetical protein RLZ92_662 [Pseudomonadota bacterium]|jgi:hypothetical protein
MPMVNTINPSISKPITPPASVGSANLIGNAAQDNNLRLDQINIGKTLMAQVISINKDGNALVNVAVNNQTGGNLRIPLPSGYKVGDQIALTLLSNDGNKPTFSVNLLANSQDTIDLSATGLFLTKILESNPEPGAIQSTTPIITTPNPDTQELATQLRQAIENSGVFYESHLKQWNDGGRSIEQIRQEPQNLLNNPELPNSMIPMQLGVLENKNLMWFGPIWPDQNMEWDVSKEQNPNPEQALDGDQKPIWFTSIKLALPNLGEITARIRLQGDIAKLDISTNNTEISHNLKAHSEELSNSLASAGITLESIAAHNQ